MAHIKSLKKVYSVCPFLPHAQTLTVKLFWNLGKQLFVGKIKKSAY